MSETGMYSPREHVQHRHNHSVLLLDGRQGGPEEFVCDVCGREDQPYSRGVYHCAVCKDWDACVACAGEATYAPVEPVPAMVRWAASFRPSLELKILHKQISGLCKLIVVWGRAGREGGGRRVARAGAKRKGRSKKRRRR